MDLSNYEEITDVTFDHKGSHLAVCHVDQGYSANLRPDALLFKAAFQPSEAIQKTLSKLYSEETINKMTYRNRLRAIEQAITNGVRAARPDIEYHDVWLKDASDDLAVFEFERNMYAVEYSVNEEGVTVLGDVLTPVRTEEVYVSAEDGSSVLMKAASWKETLSVQSPDNDNNKGDQPDDNKGEDDMSNVMTEAQVQELLEKAQADAEAKLEKARLEWEAELATKELTKSTTDFIKSLSFVDAEDAGLETVVKTLVESEDVLKAVSELLNKAEAKVQEVVAEKEAIKEEFSKQESADVEPEDQADDGVEDLQKTLAAKVAAKKAAREAARKA
ncbi:hypothetical protein [Pseudoalteromonas phage J2-1_QLiu-2017]|nr:hypothetical protein [Pseudoalteromonas phage J2-1_QLiu-2017]